MTRTRLLKAGVWTGPLFLVLYAIFFWGVAGFIPPQSPHHSAAQIAQFFDENRTAIRVGQIGGLVSSTLLFVFFAVISLEIARIEQRRPLLAMVQFAGAILLIVFFAICSMVWIAATFRSELSPSTIRMLNDVGWLMFVMVFPGYVLQMFCMAIAGFIDRSPTPTWPRWAAYLNLWVAFSGAGGGIAVFFKHGAFAWNGLIGFYVPISVFAVWLSITTVLLLRSLDRQALDDQ